MIEDLTRLMMLDSLAAKMSDSLISKSPKTTEVFLSYYIKGKDVLFSIRLDSIDNRVNDIELPILVRISRILRARNKSIVFNMPNVRWFDLAFMWTMGKREGEPPSELLEKLIAHQKRKGLL